ncbi:MAG: flavodoxin family protein [Methanomicrobiales archaeon]|jgi:multimeric flavodoxin WrbA|nr:flavodoxin family protein [Methanomicrobiales archaeon]
MKKNTQKTIVALLGSPLKGNTALLLENAISGAKKAGATVLQYHVPHLKFSSCLGFGFCKKYPSCQMEDEVTALFPILANANGCIIATPVMTMGVPGALKSFMDRCQVFFYAKYIRKDPMVPVELRKTRKTLLLAISGMNRPDNFDGLMQTINTFCDIVDAPISESLFIRDMDNILDLKTRPDFLQQAYEKGAKLAHEI